jgi:predicted nucleic acid-binding protein
LAAPDLLIPEVGNTLWKRSVLTREISLPEAEESYQDFLALPLSTEPSSRIAEHAFQLATQEHHPVYDAFYLALALERGCELITADQTLVNKLQGKFPQVRWLGSL